MCNILKPYNKKIWESQCAANSIGQNGIKTHLIQTFFVSSIHNHTNSGDSLEISEIEIKLYAEDSLTLKYIYIYI